MRTDEELTSKEPTKKAARPKAKPPLVLRSQADPPKKKPTWDKKPPTVWESLRDDFKALMPEHPSEHPADRAALNHRLAAPPSQNPVARFVRSAREAIPAEAQEGVSSALIANANQRPTTLTDRRINYNQPKPEEQPGPWQRYTNALTDVASEPRRLDPRSPGFPEGAGAAATNMLMTGVDPGGALLGGAALKMAAPVLKGAARVAGDFGSRLVDVPIPSGTIDTARRLVTSESGQMPDLIGLGADAVGNLSNKKGPVTPKNALINVPNTNIPDQWLVTHEIDNFRRAMDAGNLPEARKIAEFYRRAATETLDGAPTHQRLQNLYDSAHRYTSRALAERDALPPAPDAGSKVRNLFTDESGQALPGWAGIAGKAALDRADDTFEAAGQTLGSAARSAGTVGAAVANTAAARVAPGAQRLGDLLHVPKAAAEDAASAIARQVDLKGRTGKTADEWYQSAKHAPAATKYPVVNTILDKARQAFVSDYGVTPEMRAIAEAGRVFGNNTARPLEELGARLNKERTGAEQFDIHWQATEKTPPPGPMNAQAFLDAQEVKAVSRDADKAMEGVGALPPGVADAFDGSHLPRGYAKWWRAEGKAMDALKHPIKNLKDNIIGGFYRRGLDETMMMNEFLVKQANAAQTGEEWKLVNTHADGVTVDAHRDWTIPERQAWGEIRHASSALQRKASKVRHDASAAHVLDAYAKPGAGDAKGAFAIPTSAFTAGAPAGAVHGLLPPTRTINGQVYKLLDGTTAKESGIPKYGKLANHYVRDDVMFYLWNQNELKPFIDKINKYSMNNLWKKMVTIGNFPGYFTNNFFQNPLILERTGGSMMDMPAAWTDLASNSVNIQRLEDAGVIHNGVLARELGAQLQHFNATLSSQHMHSGFSVSKQVFRAMNALKSYEQDAYKLASASDDLYRVALVDGLMRREGKTFEEAAEIAKKAFYDSQAVTAPAAQVASTFSPFAKVLWWAANNEAEAWTKNPGKAAYINTLVSALPVAAAYVMGKDGATQDAEQTSLQKNMQGHGNNFPTPYKDGDGKSYYVDGSNWNHYNQFKPMENTAASWDLPVGVPVLGDKIGWPKGLAPGGPVMTGIQYLTNNDAYRGEKLVKRADNGDGPIISDDSNAFLARNLSPGAGRNALALYDSWMGTNEDGVSPAAKALRYTTGIKLRPADIEKAVHRNRSERESNEREIDWRIKQADKRGDTKKADELRATKAMIIAEAQKRHRKLTKDKSHDE